MTISVLNALDMIMLALILLGIISSAAKQNIRAAFAWASCAVLMTRILMLKAGCAL